VKCTVCGPSSIQSQALYSTRLGSPPHPSPQYTPSIASTTPLGASSGPLPQTVSADPQPKAAPAAKPAPKISATESTMNASRWIFRNASNKRHADEKTLPHEMFHSAKRVRYYFTMSILCTHMFTPQASLLQTDATTVLTRTSCVVVCHFPAIIDRWSLLLQITKFSSLKSHFRARHSAL
jgi:hypothetical protein